MGVLCEGPLLFDAANADGACTWAAAAQKIVVAMRGEEDRLQISRGQSEESNRKVRNDFFNDSYYGARGMM